MAKSVCQGQPECLAREASQARKDRQGQTARQGRRVSQVSLVHMSMARRVPKVSQAKSAFLGLLDLVALRARLVNGAPQARAIKDQEARLVHQAHLVHQVQEASRVLQAKMGLQVHLEAHDSLSTQGLRNFGKFRT